MKRTRYTRRTKRWLHALMLSCLTTTLGCGGTPPVGPGPIVPPPVTEPVINSVVVGAIRAEVGEAVTVRAEVEDAETPVQSLRYEWSATVGVFEGAGAVVTWHTPKGSALTPADVVITLTVVETYETLVNGAIVMREHRVTRSAPPVRLHDSVAEISAMTVRFLVDLFGDSGVSPEACVVDFTDSCRGKADELKEIADNRKNLVIYVARANVTSVQVSEDRTFAVALASCLWEDALRTDPSAHRISKGTCTLTARYETGRWWLCSSRFDGATTPITRAQIQLWLESRGAAGEWPSIARSLRRN